jgi:outer membrane protein insertion porin family
MGTSRAPSRRLAALRTGCLAAAFVTVAPLAAAQNPAKPAPTNVPAPAGKPAAPAKPAKGPLAAGAPVPAPAATTPATATAPAAAEGPFTAEPQLRPTELDRAEGQTITRITVAGNRRVTEEDVLTYLRLKPNTALKGDLLAGDVRALWDSGFFDDIQVDLSKSTRGVELRFLVRERPNVKEIVFEGNDEIDAEKLQEAVDVKANTILSIPALRRSVQKMKDAYAEKGYFLAKVDFTTEPAEDNEVRVVFKIVEGQPVTVRRIHFVGNTHVPESELREVMQTGQGGLFAFGAASGPYKQDILERDVLILQALYYDKGYMNVAFGTPRVMLTPDREGIEVSLTVNEGPRFKVRQLKVFERDESGAEVEPLSGRRAIRELITAKSGDYFNRADVVKDIQAIRTLYRDAGYANVDVGIEPDLDATKQEVDLVIPITRGPQVTVERIEIRGNTKTRDKVVRREMELEEAKLFSESKLEASRRRITALGYFERVDVSTEQGSTPDKTVVIFEVQERPTGTFQIGAGFSSVENFIATAQIQQANLFGNGQSLAVQAQFSSLRQLVNVRFFEPYFFGTDWSTSVEGYKQLYVFPDFTRDTTGASLTFGYALIQPTLRLSLTATGQYDNVDTSKGGTFFGSVPSYYANAYSRLPLANLFNTGRTLSLRPALTYDTRDNRLFPTSGAYLSASTEIANAALGSQIEFFRHQVNGRFYIPLGGQTAQPGSGFVLKANANFGMITSPNPEGVPVFLRYFLGGILDVRGYRLRTLGPRLPLTATLDPNGSPSVSAQGWPGANIGGNLQAYSNVEFEFPVLDKVGIRGVAFFDAGNTWNLENQYCSAASSSGSLPAVSRPCWNGIQTMANIRTSVGGGIRWFSPLGPLRFEWGIPLKRFYSEEPYTFEFTIGNFF